MRFFSASVILISLLTGHVDATTWTVAVDGGGDFVAIQPTLDTFFFEAVDPPIWSGPVWHVSPGGDDVAGDGSPDHPFLTIQWAIDQAASGDTVEVAVGTYAGTGNRDLDFNDKDLLVHSTGDDPETCIIECGGSEADPHRGFIFDGRETGSAIVRGFTIRGGYAAEYGGGILFTSTEEDTLPAPRIEHCIVTANEAVRGAGFAVTEGCRPYFANCVISESLGPGGGWYGRPFYIIPGSLVEDCRFENNTQNGVESLGFDSVSWKLRRCEITGNGANGLYLGTTWGGVALDSCYVADNLGWGIHSHAYGEAPDRSEDDEFRWWGQRTDHCMVTRNGSGGIYCQSENDGVSNCTITHNFGPGIKMQHPSGWFHVLENHIANNDGSGIEGNSIFCRILDNTISVNQGSGIGISYSHSTQIERNTIDHNKGSGVTIDDGPSVGDANIACNTVVANIGHGLVLAGDQEFAANSNLISHNDLLAIAPSSGINLSISCSNLFNNAGGDWVGEISDFLGIDGNIAADPRFCDATAGDYHLAANSPCAPAANPACGLIGALDVDCGSRYFISGTIRDLRGWAMRSIEMVGLPNSPTTDDQGYYCVLVGDDWFATVTPTYPPVTFVPAERIYANLTSDQLDDDYVGAVEGLVDIDIIQSYNPVTGMPDSPYLDLLVTVEGVVTLVPGTFSSGGGYIQGVDAGINFFTNDPLGLQLGDRVGITGYLWPDSNYEIYLGNPEIDILESGPAPDPLTVAIADLVDGLEWVGSFVEIAGHVIEKGVLESPAWEYVRVADAYADADVVVYAHPNTDVDFDSVALDDAFIVAGICTKFGNGVRVGPRFLTDYLVTTEILDQPSVPDVFAMHGCRPNPFNPSTTVAFDLPAASSVDLRIYDVQGRLVRTLVGGETIPAGRHAVRWLGRDDAGRRVAAGVFLCRLVAGDDTANQRLTLVK